VLLSGGSGLLGTALHRALLGAREAEVLQLVRRDANGIGELKWDPGAPSPIANLRALEGMDAAVHLSGASVAAHRWTAAYKHEMRRSRVESTRVLAAALAKLEQPPRTLLVASAAGIYGNRGDEILDEKSAPGEGFLAEVCKEWEAAARPAEAAGIRVVHLRFGVVLAAHDGALGKMLPFFRLGLGGPLGSGRQWMSWVNIEDAVVAILFAMDTPALAGALNLTAPEPVTNAEFTRSLGRAVHRPAILPAPAIALRLAFGEMADEALLSSARIVPSRLVGAGFRFAYPTLDAALEAALHPSS
jgi:uncharacterized protein